MNAKLELTRRDAKQKGHLVLMQRIIKEFAYIDITEYQYENIQLIIRFLRTYSDLQLIVALIGSKSENQKCDESVIQLIKQLKDFKKRFNKHKELLKKFGYLEVIREAENVISEYRKTHGKISDFSKDY